MGFTKLDEGILQSSVMAEDSDTFKVWIALLAACRDDGIARISEIYISSVCHLSIETVVKSLGKLRKPDPYSRTKDSDGIRIRDVDGGFEVVNYLKYRARSVTEYERERKRQQRFVPDSPGQSRDVPGRSASASDSASVQNGEEIDKSFQAFWTAYPKKVHKDDAREAFRTLRLGRKGKAAPVGDAEIAAAIEGYCNLLKKQAKDRGRELKEHLEYAMNPATFLRKNRWRDYVGIKKGL